MVPPPFLLVGKGAQAKLSAFDNDQSVNARGVGFEVTLLRGGFHDKSGAIGKLRQASVRIVPEGRRGRLQITTGQVQSHQYRHHQFPH